MTLFNFPATVDLEYGTGAAWFAVWGSGKTDWVSALNEFSGDKMNVLMVLKRRAGFGATVEEITT